MAQPQGTRRVRLITNSFAITTLPTKEYYQYDDISPVIESKVIHRKIQLIQHLQNTVAPDIFNPRLVYDGGKIAYSPRRLNLAGNRGGTFHISLGQTQQVAPGTKGAYAITLNQTLAPPINPQHVKDLTVDTKRTDRSTVATNLIQLVIRQGPNLVHTNNGRAYFTGKEKMVLQTNKALEVWRGIFHSVRPSLGKMILTIDTCVAAVYKEQPLIDTCMMYLDRKRPDIRDLKLREDEPTFKLLEKFLKNLHVTIQLAGGRSRTKTIRGLVARGGEYEFEKDGVQINVSQHFKHTHNITIRYPEIIGIRLTGQKSPRQDIVPIEVCAVKGGQLYKRKLAPEQGPEVIKFATLRPDDRLRRIKDAAQTYRASEFVVESGMVVDTQPLTVDGKRLEPPRLTFGSGTQPVPIQGGAWNVVGRQLNVAKALTSWAVLNFCGARFPPSQIQRSIQELGVCCSKLGMRVEEPLGFFEGHPGAVDMALRNVVNKVADAAKRREQVINPSTFILLVILPESAAPIRQHVKWWGDVSFGAITQCMKQSKFERARDQYWNNIALKINARLGGINAHASFQGVLHTLKKAPYMIMGADVGHAGPGMAKPSVTGLVYSLDADATRYAALTGFQPPRVEVIENMTEYARLAVYNFSMNLKAFPVRIIFFRDGLSEGEFQEVAGNEIKQIRDGIRQAYEQVKSKLPPNTPPPMLTFVVVGKRHHTLLFPSGREESDGKTGNCLPGSIIESGITHPVDKNFYLQSHSAIQGTSRSSHYTVLLDENFGGNINVVQELAFALCHVYAKATRSVSIPAPVYYADLVCSRGAFHLNPNEQHSFSDTASTASGGSTFDISPWMSAFRPVHNTVMPSMYFL